MENDSSIGYESVLVFYYLHDYLIVVVNVAVTWNDYDHCGSHVIHGNVIVWIWIGIGYENENRQYVSEFDGHGYGNGCGYVNEY